MNNIETTFENFYRVAIRGQSYRNLLYLMLAFPLGIFYFIFLVTGLSLGVGLLIVWVGLLILVGVMAAWWGMAAFERWLAVALLGEAIPAMTREDLSNRSLWQKFTATLRNPVTWKSLVYLLARFPLGIFFFVVLVTMGSVSLALIAAPFYYNFLPTGATLTVDGARWAPLMVDTLSEAVLACLVGVFLALATLHVSNGLAWLSGRFARAMLGNFTAAAQSAGAQSAGPEVPAAANSFAPRAE